MIMIKNYIYTVGTYLSTSQKDEVLTEIESNIYDYLEENFGEKEYTLVEVEKAIRTMGHPKEVAEAYMNSPRCLIGPTYIDTYWLLLKIAVIGTAIGLMSSNILSFHESDNLLQLFLKVFSSIWNASLSVVGTITLIFAAISYYGVGESSSKDANWSLSILSEAPKPDDHVSMLELIIEMFFVFLGLAILNHSSSFFGLSITNTSAIPAINMKYFSPYIIWLNLLLGSFLILNVYLLIKRKWQLLTRVLTIALKLASFVLFTLLALTPNVLDYASLPMVFSKSSTDTIHGIQLGVYIGLGVFIIMTILDITNHLRVLLKRTKM